MEIIIPLLVVIKKISRYAQFSKELYTNVVKVTLKISQSYVFWKDIQVQA
ncbi:hypothetical protein SESBI_38659 [Sesbania bispinosa]|nr:hypothetical protein SESBI_38659 [Sesbania bispinosa]